MIRRVAGRPVRRFERVKSAAAEALDTTVYAFAARYALAGVDFDTRAQRLAHSGRPPTPAPPLSRPVRRSSYMGR